MATARRLAERSRKIKEEADSKSQDEEVSKPEPSEKRMRYDETDMDTARGVGNDENDENEDVDKEGFFGDMPLSDDLIMERLRTREKLRNKTGLSERDLKKIEDDFSMVVSTFGHMQFSNDGVSQDKKIDGWEAWMGKHFPKQGSPKNARKIYDFLNDVFRKFVGCNVCTKVREEMGIPKYEITKPSSDKEGFSAKTAYLTIVGIIDLIAAILGLVPGFGLAADAVGILASLLAGDIVGILLSITALIPLLGTIPGVIEIIWRIYRMIALYRKGKSSVRIPSQSLSLMRSRKSYRKRPSSSSSSKRRSSSSRRDEQKRDDRSSSSRDEPKQRRDDRSSSRDTKRSIREDTKRYDRNEPTSSYDPRQDRKRNDYKEDVTSMPYYEKQRRRDDEPKRRPREEDTKRRSRDENTKQDKMDTMLADIDQQVQEISDFRSEQETRNREKRQKIEEAIAKLEDIKDQRAEQIRELQKEKEDNRDDLDRVNEIRAEQRDILKKRNETKKMISQLEKRLKQNE